MLNRIADVVTRRHQGFLTTLFVAVATGLAVLSAASGFVPAQDKSGQDNPAPKDKKPSPLEDLARKIKEQIAATSPPAWKPRTDSAGDPLPAGAVARLGTTRFRHGASIVSIAYSPDGKLLAAGGSDNQIRLFDAESGKEVHLLPGHQGSTFVMPAKPSLQDYAAPTGKVAPVTAIAFAPDGKLLASGGWDNTIRLWDPATGRLLRVILAHRSVVSALTFSPDGKVLASRGGLDGLVRLWDPATGKELRTIDRLPLGSSALAFTPDSTSLAVGDAKAISVREVESGKEVQQLEQPGTVCLAYSVDGKHLAAGGRDGTLRIWDVAAGRELRRCALPKKEPPSHVAFSADGKTLAAAVRETKALLFDVATGMPAHILDFYWPDAVAFSPGGSSVAFAGEPSAVRIWDVQSDKELHHDRAAHQSPVTHVEVSGDGKMVISGGDGVRIWDGESGKTIRTIPIPGRYVEALALSPDGRTLATGGRDKMVRLWELKSGQEVQAWKHEGTLRALAFSADGKMLASGDLRLNIRLWDLEAAKEAHKITIQATYTDRLSLAFAPDGKVLAVGGALNADWPRAIPSTDPYGIVPVLDKGYPVQLFDTQTGKQVGRLDGLVSRIRSLAYSPDGKLLAAASADGRIALWDMASGKERLQFLAHPDNQDSPFRSSPSIAFAPDGQSLASASADGTLRLWDPATGRERGRLETGSRTYAVAFARDGKALLTGQADTTVLRWDAEFLAVAVPLGKRNFSIGHFDLR